MSKNKARWAALSIFQALAVGLTASAGGNIWLCLALAGHCAWSAYFAMVAA